ncbi:MAG: hypothetical protein ACN4GM_10360 [Gammaproteobacteria bacterium]
MRIRTKWHKKDRVVSVEEKANTLAFIAWRIAAAMVLNLENENFQTDTQQQRLDVIKEILAFLISVTDRMVVDQMSLDERQDLISKMALKLIKVMQENSEDLIGKGDFQGPFIELLNERMNAYAICSWDGDEPGYQYKRDFGDYVARQMGEKDNKWITTHIIDIEVPQVLETLTKAKLEMVDGGSTAQLGS